MIHCVNDLMDQHDFDLAFKTVLNALVDAKASGHPNPAVLGFSEHYLALVVLSGWEFYIECARGEHGEERRGTADEDMAAWASWLPHGLATSRTARRLMPEYQPGQKMGARYEALATGATTTEVFRTGKLLTEEQSHEMHALIAHAEELRQQRQYLDAIAAYDSVLEFMGALEYAGSVTEGQIHRQIATCIKNGRAYAVRADASALATRFAELMPRGLHEAREARRLIPDDPTAAKLERDYDELQAEVPELFADGD